VNSDSAAPIKNHGWRVTFAGLGINLMLGILYTWSVISGGVPDEWGWSQADKSLPYIFACLVFSLVMVPAGRMQDKVGPKLTASIGGLLVGVGMIISSLTTSAIGYTIGFGILTGAGFGFGYASATPPAVKWFPKKKTGLIAGLVVSGFGLASVYAAPLSEYMIGAMGLSWTIRTLGIAFLVIVVGLSMLLTPPPKGYSPESAADQAASAASTKKEEFLPSEMLKTWQFYMLWFMYACGAGAGLMIISVCKKIVKGQGSITATQAAIAVAVLGIGNGAGRVLAGVFSDKLGRTLTMFGCFVLQAGMLVLLSLAKEGNILTSLAMLMVLSFLMGGNYGANLSLFPSITKDFYGLKNFGMNYGLVFTAWGVGGFVLARVAGEVYDRTKSFAFAYYTAAALLIVAAVMSFVVKAPHHTDEKAA
jgi:nitrate/nitrite transporter NarK